MIRHVIELRLLDRGDGACKHLIEEADGVHSCSIYENRPSQCRVDESVPPVLQLAEWQSRNERMCKVLRLAVYGGE